MFSEGANFIVTDMLRTSAAGEPWTALFVTRIVGFSEKYTVRGSRNKEVWARDYANLSTEPSRACLRLRPRVFNESGGEWIFGRDGHRERPIAQAKTRGRSRISFPIDRSTIEIDPARPGDFAQLYFQVTHQDRIRICISMQTLRACPRS